MLSAFLKETARLWPWKRTLTQLSSAQNQQPCWLDKATTTVIILCGLTTWVFPKNRGKTPKMDGENNGKPY